MSQRLKYNYIWSGVSSSKKKQKMVKHVFLRSLLEQFRTSKKAKTLDSLSVPSFGANRSTQKKKVCVHCRPGVLLIWGWSSSSGICVEADAASRNSMDPHLDFVVVFAEFR